jgi:PII-like signaling protein
MENKKCSILKIYASTTDKIGSKLLYEYLVHKAKDQGLSGVTVYRGIMGYGASSKISSSRFWELTEKLPVTIEILDETKKIEAFYTLIEPELINMPKGCLVILEPITIKMLKSGESKIQ